MGCTVGRTPGGLTAGRGRTVGQIGQKCKETSLDVILLLVFIYAYQMNLNKFMNAL